ncbi:MAG: hypothetical protein WBD41_09825 [Rhodococcus sp. (in: high G+C Gram-positive bacteria)]|jgi:hypothetical protein|uniref:hypothetical protein n=1 Tax=Rhodococcus sp. KRD162 TaxID=2729725 RepID=UPI0019D2911F|nr:hypothetical protein [Rhodococcus sp. KRD162]
MSTHTHEPAIHPVQMPGTPRRRYLLGSAISIAGLLLLPVSAGYLLRMEQGVSVPFLLLLVTCVVGSQVAATQIVESAYWHVPTKDLDRLPRWPSVIKRSVVTALIALVAAVSMAYGDGLMHLTWVLTAAGILGIAWTLTLGSLLDRFFGGRKELERRDATWMVGEMVSAAVIASVVWLQFDGGLVESAVEGGRGSEAVEVLIGFGLAVGIAVVGFPLVALRWWRILSARSKV